MNKKESAIFAASVFILLVNLLHFFWRTDFIFPWHLRTWNLAASGFADWLSLPTSARLPAGNLWDEIVSCLSMPGFSSGVVCSLLVNSIRRIWLVLLPSVVLILSVLILSLILPIGHGPVAQYVFLPLFVSTIYSTVGALLGCSLRYVWRIGRGGASVLVFMFLGSSASAWDDVVGHPYIVERAVVVLDRDEPNKYREIVAFDGIIRAGAQEEDRPLSRVVSHFHNPVTSRGVKGLRVLDPGFGPVESSLDKAASLWAIAKEQYKDNKKILAYQSLGRIAHLITGDAYQPGHTHDDPHTWAVFGGDSQSIEDRFQAKPSVVTALGLVASPIAAPLTESTLISVGNSATLTAYMKSRLGGTLNRDADIDAELAGHITLQNNSTLPIFFRVGDPESSNKDYQLDHFEILLPHSRNLIYHPGTRGDIGISRALNQDFWELPDDEESGGNQYFYIDRMELVYIGQERMDDYYIRHLIGPAIKDTAGLLRAAAKAFDSLPPNFTIRTNNSQGELVQPNVFVGRSVYIQASDMGNLAPSGIYQLELKNLTLNQPISLSPPIAALGEKQVERVVSDLQEGEYQLKAYDGTGNESTFNFHVVHLPELAFGTAGDVTLNIYGQPAANGDTFNRSSMTIHAVSLSGITRVSISPALYEDVIWNETGVDTNTYTTYDDLDDGDYTVSVFDAQGRISIASFTIVGGDHVVPLLRVHENSCTGNTIHNEDSTSDSTLYIKITESSATDKGLKDLAIIGVNAGNNFVGNKTFVGMSSVCFSTSLPVGEYWTYARDLNNNTTSQTFTILSTAAPHGPLVTLQDQSSLVLYHLFSGVSLSTPAALAIGVAGGDNPDTASLTLRYNVESYLDDESFAITTVTVTGSTSYNYVSGLSPPVDQVDESTLPVMRAGSYVMKVETVGGGVTRLPFKVVDLHPFLCDDIDTVFISSHSFSIDNAVCLTATLGVKSIQDIDVLGNPLDEPVPASGTTDVHIDDPFTVDTVSEARYYQVTDNGGFTSRPEVGASPGVFGLNRLAAVEDEALSLSTSNPHGMRPESARAISAHAEVYLATVSIANLPLTTDPQVVGSLEISVGGVTAVSGDVIVSTVGMVSVASMTTSNTPFSVPEVVEVVATLTPAEREAVFASECQSTSGSTCTSGKPYVATSLASVYASIAGVIVGVGNGPAAYRGVAASETETTINLEDGFQVTFPEGHGAGQIIYHGHRKHLPPLRYKDITLGGAIEIDSDVSHSGNATITMKCSTAGLTTEQVEGIVILHANAHPALPEDYHPLETTLLSTAASAQINDVTGSYMVAAPIHSTPHIVTNGGLKFQSDSTGITSSTESGNSLALRLMMAKLRAQGLAPVTSIVRLGPDGATFDNPGVVQMEVSDGTLAAYGISRNTLRILQFTSAGVPTRMPGQSHGNERIAAKVPGLTSNFAVFGATTPVYIDLVPPITTAVFVGTSAVDAANNVLITSRTGIGFTAVDPMLPYLGVSGSSRTYYGIDTTYMSTTATPGTLYSSTFTLSTGTHRMWFYGVDVAGNYESVRVSTVIVGAVDQMAPRTALLTGYRSSISSTTVYVSSVSPIGFAVQDDLYSLYDSLGVGATQTFYAVDSTTSYTRFTTSFTIVGQGTHTLAFYSIDRDGHVESVSTRSISVDWTPPVTTLVMSGSFLTLPAVDPVTTAVASGVQKIWYLVDFADPSVCNGATPSTSAARGTCENPWYGGAHYLPSGSHPIHYYAIDNTGSSETMHSQTVNVNSQSYLGGVGIAGEHSGTVFTVTSLDESLALANTDTDGSLISSATLENAHTGMPWSVYISSSGYVYAIGMAGSEEEAAQVGVYRLSDSGSSIDDVISFDSGFDNNDIPLSANQGGWITGGAQINGDPEEDGDIALALWKFTPGSGSVVLSTHYARTSFDIGTDVAVDPDGSLWVTGYSYNSVSEGVDLGLWHYDDDGQTLLGGPYYKETFLANTDGEIRGRVYASTYSVYVAAPRFDGESTDMAFLRFDKSSEEFASESVWQASGNESSYPEAILPVDTGFLVAGGVGDEYSTAMLWRYGYAGDLQSATYVEAGGARAATFSDGQLWLGVDGATGPYKVTTEYAASGEQADNQPPRTYLYADSPSLDTGATVYVLPETNIHLYAYDNRAVIGDGLGVGTTQTFYAKDSGSYSLYAGTFNFVSEGTHTVRAFSVDLEGRVEAVSTRTVAVDLTAPTIDLFSLGSQFYFKAEDVISSGVASGVGSIFYVVDPVNDCEGIPESTSAAPGSCANPYYEGPFTVAPGTHTVYFVAFDVLGNESDDYEVDIEVSGLTTVTPSSGPIGSLIDVDGTDFGPYYSTASFVRIGGSTVSIHAWSDTSIVARVPALSSGPAAVYVQIETPYGTQLSATSYFTVTVPTITTVSPSSAPIGAPFTLTGQNFGAYTSTLAFVRFGASTAPITSWSETSIAGTVPGVLSTGSTSIRVERWAGTTVSSSAASSFLVLLPVISTMDPSFGPEDTIVTVLGQGFGPYDEDNTLLLVDGSSVDVSVWADRTIVWTVPGYLGDGEYPVVVRRTPAGGSVESSSMPFTVGSGFGGGSFFGAPQPLAAKPDKAFMGSLRLTRGRGGRVHAPAKAAVIVPAGALSGDAEISLKRLPSEPLRTRAFEDIRARSAGEPIEFGPEGERFDAPVTIELPYDPELVDAKAKVAIHYFNALRRVWEPLESVVDTVRKVVTATTSHFSIYQPLNIAPSTAAQDEFYYRDHYAYPNPSRNGAHVYFRIQPGLAQTVEVRVYDTAGRKVHDSSDFTYLGAIDDGNGKGAQNTYDHRWDVRGAGSGVYTFVLKASQAGQKPIIKSGKVAVIR